MALATSLAPKLKAIKNPASKDKKKKRSYTCIDHHLEEGGLFQSIYRWTKVSSREDCIAINEVDMCCKKQKTVMNGQRPGAEIRRIDGNNL
jgi:hypothetical protein